MKMINSRTITRTCFVLPLFVFWAFPASTNYQLESFEFGGGGGVMDSSSYSIEGILGEVSGEQSSTNFSVNSGLVFVQNANTPKAPTFVNSDNWYNKLHLMIDASDNASDTKFAIAISSDNFTTTEYVQNDQTIGDTLGAEDYQTYAEWGGVSGDYIIGLEQNTTYTVKLKAIQGSFTESPYGPTASVATSNVTLSFDIDVSSTDNDTSAPYSVDFGSLTLAQVNTASDKIWVDLTTNAAHGGFVYIYDAYAGLRSTNADYTISALSSDLSGVEEGYGVRADTVAESSGGPFAVESPYDGSGDSVGLLDTTIRAIFSTTNSPVTGARGSILLKAKPSNLTPASSDYSDILTIISAATF